MNPDSNIVSVQIRPTSGMCGIHMCCCLGIVLFKDIYDVTKAF